MYGRGEAVAVSRAGTTWTGVTYLGKDILGSVRTGTGGQGALESLYEYDAFGSPWAGEFDTGMELGYTGKPWDIETGLYDYGYRDYKPETVRFTTADPVQDGVNWFSYVNNDPVNWIDPWGLSASDKMSAFFSNVGNAINSKLANISSNVINGIAAAFNVVSTYTGITSYIAGTEGLISGAESALNGVSIFTGLVAVGPSVVNAVTNPSIDSVSTAAGDIAGLVSGFPLGLLAAPAITNIVKAGGETAKAAAGLNQTLKTNFIGIAQSVYNYFTSYK